ncbi:hypothetical protein BDW69DRAFT_192712 [Aspergillus filifer]
MHPIGPFIDTKTFLRASTQHNLDRIQRGEMYSSRPIDAYLIHRFLLDTFTNHISVHQWAYTDRKSWAFTSPIMLLDVDEFYNGKLEPSADEEYFAQCFEEKGRSDLAQIVKKGWMLHVFGFCNGYNITLDFEGFKGLFDGLQRALGVESDSDGNADNGFGWDKWRERALREYKDDEFLKELIALEHS